MRTGMGATSEAMEGSASNGVIKGGGARVDGVKVEDVEQEVALAGAEVKLSSGKKKHALLVAK